MARYLISFGAHAMDHVPASDLPGVGSAARAVVQEIVAAGALVVAGGMADVPAAVVAVDGTMVRRACG